jgi:hypothetical protein
LQSRSSAIRTALDRYNIAALALDPPRRTLEWKEVVEYAFLADFDLLRDARQDISQRPWATPAGRLAMDKYFKMCRATEEIHRLNIEIRRVATYIQDEDQYLRTCEDQVHRFDPSLAHQIGLHRSERARFKDHHLRELQKIAKLRGFNGTILPGESASEGVGESASTPAIVPPTICIMEVDLQLAPVSRPVEQLELADTEGDLEDEEEDEEEVEEVSRGLIAILSASNDP